MFSPHVLKQNNKLQTKTVKLKNGHVHRCCVGLQSSPTDHLQCRNELYVEYISILSFHALTSSKTHHFTKIYFLPFKSFDNDPS